MASKEGCEQVVAIILGSAERAAVGACQLRGTGLVHRMFGSCSRGVEMAERRGL
jgi:hypothetical protein